MLTVGVRTLEQIDLVHADHRLRPAALDGDQIAIDQPDAERRRLTDTTCTTTSMFAAMSRCMCGRRGSGRARTECRGRIWAG
jgi:hypothetical protein